MKRITNFLFCLSLATAIVALVATPAFSGGSPKGKPFVELDGKIVEVSIFGDSPGTYELNPLQSLTQMQGLWKPDGTSTGQNYVSVRGTASLTEVDTTNKMISGTFEFVAARTINDTVYVQNGAFNKLSYSDQ